MSEASELNTHLSLPKPLKTPAHLRKPQILALQAAGWTQERMAQHFGVSRTTIVTDLQQLQPARDQVETALSQLVNSIDMLHTLEDSAVNYVDLAKNAKNEAVRLATEDRIADFRGIVTEKERIRAKQSGPSEPQPIFQRSPGMNISFTFQQFNQQQTTISRDEASLHNTPTVTRDITPTTSSNDALSIDTASGDDTVPHE